MKHARRDYNRIQDPAAQIPADEPVFLLRGQDPLAPSVVRNYAALCKAIANRDNHPVISPNTLTPEGRQAFDFMAVTLERQADAMDAWQQKMAATIRKHPHPPDLTKTMDGIMRSYDVLPDKVVPGEWRVESAAEDGGVEVTIFSGPKAEDRAKTYAHYMNSGAMMVYLTAIGR
jgi:hypothetical protein